MTRQSLSPVASVRRLRLDRWRPVPGSVGEAYLLGSLSPLLADFAATGGRAVVPTQRGTPEMTEYLG
jgi:hypothetical protein